VLSSDNSKIVPNYMVKDYKKNMMKVRGGIYMVDQETHNMLKCGMVKITMIQWNGKQSN